MPKKPIATQKKVIDPKELIAELSIEEFNKYSDEYYERLPLPEFQMAKPFSMVSEAPEHFRLIGAFLDGLRISPGMRVLDFGAGTCWLSKMIWRLGCPVVALDVSEKALAFGKRLFDEFPVPLKPDCEYEFSVFDGRRIELPDESIDRIVCYDVFHHVPNPEEVMREFHRVLAPGGVIGFNEPLGNHSTTSESQNEMRTYHVLENDLDIDELGAFACSLGFSQPRFKVNTLPKLEIGLDERNGICGDAPFSRTLTDAIRNAMRSSGVFFFDKEGAIMDSRAPDGLRHEISLDIDRIILKVDEVVTIKVRAKNVGKAKWLSGDPTKIGTVNVGTQLYDTEGQILSVDLTRGKISKDVLPGEALEVKVPLLVRQTGKFRIGFDMVSELVTWFKVRGSEVVYIDVEVLPADGVSK